MNQSYKEDLRNRVQLYLNNSSYKDHSTNEIIDQLKKGNKYIDKEFAMRYFISIASKVNLIYSTKINILKSIDSNDIDEIILSKMFEVAEQYIQYKGHFSAYTFFLRQAKSEVNNVIRKYFANKRIVQEIATTMKDPENNHWGNNISIETINKNLSHDAIISIVKKAKLTESEYQVFTNVVIYGHSLLDISNMKNITRLSACNAYRRSIKKIKNLSCIVKDISSCFKLSENFVRSKIYNKKR